MQEFELSQLAVARRAITRDPSDDDSDVTSEHEDNQSTRDRAGTENPAPADTNIGAVDAIRDAQVGEEDPEEATDDLDSDGTDDSVVIVGDVL